MTQALKVAIDARLPDKGQGGVQQVINTLSSGFAELNDNSIARCWLVLKGTTWWRGSFPIDDEIIEVAAPFGRLSLRVANRFPKLVSLLFPLINKISSNRPPYDTVLQEKGVDLVHLPFQDGFDTQFPTVYHPHDLQHRYLTTNFNSSQIKHRETVWKKKAIDAQIVMAASPYVLQDLEQFWNIEPDKIQMIPIPPPERKESDKTILRGLPSRFSLYPAAFWGHKNHKQLLKSIHLLQQSGLEIPLVLVGAQVGDFTAVKKLCDQLHLEKIVYFLGHVTNAELTALIVHADIVVIPSLFEAMSLTVWDAQKLGTAVACSNIAPFPCQVGNTAQLFDPHDPASIAEALSRLWTNSKERLELASAGKSRVSGLTASNYARAMIGIYHLTVNRQSSELNTIAKEMLVSSICSKPI